jgi:hypothetical protein
VQTEEERKLVEARKEENRKALEKVTTKPRCTPQIVSNYDLELKEVSPAQDLSS